MSTSSGRSCSSRAARARRPRGAPGEIRQRGFALQCRVTTEDPATVPPRRRAHHRLPLAGRRRRATGRGLGLRRRRGLPFLRPAAGQGHRARAGPAERDLTGAARGRGAAGARRQDQPGLPRRAAQRPGRSGRRDAHDVRRRAARARRAAAPGGDRATRLLAGSPRSRSTTRRRTPAAPRPRAKLPATAGGRPAAGLAPAPARTRPARVRRATCASSGDRADRHHAARRPPVAVRHAAAHARHAARGAASRARAAADAVAWRCGAARRSTSRCASCTRTRGTASPRCANGSPTSACRCSCAGATCSATRATPSRSCAPSSPRRSRRASTSSASSTRSTTSSRCARRSRRRSRRARSRRARCATRATSRTPRERLTRSTTTCGSPSSSSRTGVHVLAIKDMAGLLRAPAARTLVSRLRERVRPARPPAHARHRRRAARHLPRRDRGRRRRRRRRRRADGGDDEPALPGEHRRRDATTGARTGLALDALLDLEPYWESVRTLYGAVRDRPAGADRTPLPPRDPRRAALQPAPAGRRRRARRTASRRSSWPTSAPTACSANIVKVTPSSKVVGDLALFAVSGGIDFDELARAPATVRPARLRARLPARRARRAGRAASRSRSPTRALPAASRRRADEELDGRRRRAAGRARRGARARALSEILFPGPADDCAARARALRRRLPDPDRGRSSTACATTRSWPSTSSRASGSLRARGHRRARRPRDAHRARAPQRPAAPDRRARRLRRGATAPGRTRRPQPARPRRRAADRRASPLLVAGGRRGRAGRARRVLEAMKMESTITAPAAGQGPARRRPTGTRLEQGDLLLVIEPS